MELWRDSHKFTFLLLIAVTVSSSLRCDRMLTGVTVERTKVDDEFQVILTNLNRTDVYETYMPNTKYLITLKGDKTEILGARKFTRFFLSVEADDDSQSSGSLDLVDDTLSKFSDQCTNGVEETSKVPKEEISVIWTSPSDDAECISIRASVMETLETWYADEGPLGLNVCQDAKAKADDQGIVLPECCACDEAKYEVAFEGLWSRNTHPKDFPSKTWLIRFSDVIGASHTVEYRFWQYNGKASEGLKQVAENGSTRTLESELKEQSDHIRTIIKARGIMYPNVTGRTFAVFRVDRKHHLVSLVSMIGPSPDWIVGVSGLELCMANCSWVPYKELNLYPYDAGTDDGITYISEDSPTDPQEPIRRITTSYPNDSRSPFFDPSGQEMKPMAKLHLTRQRIYEKTCENPTTDSSHSGGAPTHKQKHKACKVTPWGHWSACSVTCGQGTQLRQRRYRDDAAAVKSKCNVPLTDRATCYGDSANCDEHGYNTEILNNPMCELTDWSEWSSCTSTCGPGSKTRARNFRHKNHRKHCKAAGYHVPLQQTIDCENPTCENAEDVAEVRPLSEQDESGEVEEFDDADEAEETDEWLQKCPRERYTEWSMWSPCSSSCGPGVKLRSRLVDNSWSNRPEEDDSLEECKVQQAACTAVIPTCDFSKDEAERICSEPMEKGRCNGNIIRVYFDKHMGRCKLFSYTGCDGNRNNFPTEQDCNNVCANYETAFSSTENTNFNGIQTRSQILSSKWDYDENEKVDCKLSEWSNWSRCRDCRGHTTSTRQILEEPRNGGRKCQRKLMRRKKCQRLPECSLQEDQEVSNRSSRETLFQSHSNAENCKVSEWSAWSHCSATCGKSVRHRFRYVRKYPEGRLGKLCPHLAEFWDCTKPACQDEK